MLATRALVFAVMLSCIWGVGVLEAAAAKQKAAPAAGGKHGATELSIWSSSATDAKCAFTRLLSDGEVAPQDLLTQIEKFAARKGMLFPTAHLLTYYVDVPSLVSKLVERPSPQSRQLAAATMVFSTLGDYLEGEKRQALSQVVPEDDGGAADDSSAKKKRNRKNQKKDHAPSLALLFADKSSETLELAILAAAYAGEGSVKAQVDGVPVSTNSSGIAGARLLYYARTGVPVTEQQVVEAIAPARYPAGYITNANPELANFNLLLPAEAYVCEAFGILKDGKHLEYLHRMLGHPDLRVQMEAVRAIRKIASRDSLPFLLKKLNTCEWPVLVDVCSVLAAMPARESIPPLLARLKRESGRFRLDVTYALSAIAGHQVGQEYKEWENWWNRTSATFQVNEGASKAFTGKTRVQDIILPSLGFFYSLSIYSDHFSYVVDSSNSMKGDKMANLRQNLCSSIDSLKPWVYFNITDFGGTVTTMNRHGLVKDKSSGKERTKEMTHSGGTRVYDAIEDAAGVKGVDTVFLLTDGLPTKGQINQWKDLYRAMTIMNRYRQLTVSTVAFLPTDRSEASLKKMADENVGRNDIAH